MAANSNFLKYYLSPLAGIVGGFLITWFTYYLNKNDNRLAFKEKTEVKAPDGTITKREFETYR